MATKPRRIHLTLLTTPHCAFCEDAKATLTRVAQEYPLVVEMVDLGSPAGEQLALQGGVLFPPGLFLDGEPFSYGRVSERKLRRELASRCASISEEAKDAANDTGKDAGPATERLVV